MLSLGNKISLTTQPIYKFVNEHSIQFDGSDQRIITDGADTVAQPTTYSFWCKASETGQNRGVFGHGSVRRGGFHFNYLSNRPLLYLGSNYFKYWDDTSAQDDGEWHHWVVYSDTNDITNSKLYVDGVLQTVNQTETSGSLDAYTESLTIGSEKQVGGNSFEGKIDEFAVYDRELTQAEITRMYNTYYSPNRVANGNFSQIGNEEVTNGDFSQIGSEEVTNGDFATDSDWNKNTGWTISGGKANKNSLDVNYITQDFSGNGQYKVTYTISNYVSGNVRVRIGTSFSTNIRSANGTYTEYLSKDSASFGFFGEGEFSLDNVSVKEVGQDWSFGTDITIENEKAFFNDSAYPQAIEQTNVATVGKQYKVSFTVSDYQSGTVKLRHPFEVSGVQADGDYVFYGEAATTGITLRGDGVPNNFKIDNISVKEVGQHWTFGNVGGNNGWRITDTNAICDTNASVKNRNIASDFSLVSGKDYKLTIDILQSADNMQVLVGSTTLSATLPTGTNLAYEYTISGADHTGGVLAFYAGTSDLQEIDNIVVQELKHDATNLMLNHSEYQSANPLITSTKSMDFDGTDDYLNISDPTTTDLDFTDGIISCSAWIYLTSNSYGTVLNKGGGYYWYVGTAPTGITQRVFLGNSGGKNSSTALTINKWHHIAFTSDNSNIKFYIDGKLDNTVSASYTIAANTDDLTLGRSGSGEYLEGNLTEVGMYNRTLTDLEVASLYNQGMPTNLLVNRNNYQSGNPTVFNTKQIDFDGVDDRLEANSTLGSFTGSVSFWVKRTDSASHQYLIDFRKTSGTGYVYVEDNTGTIFVSSGTVYVDGVAGTTISEDNWHNIVVTGISLNITECIVFGSRYTYSQFFNGDISQVGLWNTTLTADEVSSLYNHGLPIDLTTDQAAYSSSSNLVGYWRMGSGTLDSYPLIADQTNATLGSNLVEVPGFETTYTANQWLAFSTPSTLERSTNQAYEGSYSLRIAGTDTQGVQASATQFIGDYTVGDVVKITAYVYPITSPNNRIKTGVNNSTRGITTNYDNLVLNQWNKVEYYVTISTASNNYISFLNSGTGEFYLDTVSAEIVQGNPAIMTNQTSSDIENGSPYANIVQNGTFDTDSDWSKQAGWTISGGTANFVEAGGNRNIYQNILTIGKTYKLTYTVLNYVSGAVRNVSASPYIERTANGTYTEIFTSNNYTNLYLKCAVDSQLSIDNVTVEEVNTGLQGYWKMGDGTNDEYPVIYDQTNPTNGSELCSDTNFSSSSNWNLGSNTTITNNKATLSVTGGSFEYATNIGLDVVNTKTYKFVFTANRTSGTGNLIFGYANGNSVSNSPQISTSGTQTIYFKPTYNTPDVGFKRYDLSGDYTWEISDFSVKEVQGNPATMTNMLEGNITNQYPLTKIRNYYRMGDGILDGYPIIQDQTSPNLAHIPTTNIVRNSSFTTDSIWIKVGATIDTNTNKATVTVTGGGYAAISQSLTYTSGEKYTVSATINGTSGKSMRIMDNSGNTGGLTTSNGIVAMTGVDQNVKITFTANSNSQEIGFFRHDSGDYNFTVSNVQVEEQSQATAYIKSEGIAAVRKSSTTNLIPYSEDFSEWTASNMADVTTQRVLASDITSPDGTIGTSYKLTASQVSSRIQISQQTLSQTYTKSIFVKYAGANTTIRLDGSDTNDRITFDVASSGVTLNTASSNVISHNIESFSNDWYKVSVVLPSGNDYFQVLPDSVNGNSYAYFWGAQLEEQTQAETYAKTTGLPVTIDLFTENNYGTMTNMSASDIVEDTP